MKEVAKCVLNLFVLLHMSWMLVVRLGYLVKAFQDLGVKSIGIDVSEYILKRNS